MTCLFLLKKKKINDMFVRHFFSRLLKLGTSFLKARYVQVATATCNKTWQLWWWPSAIDVAKYQLKEILRFSKLQVMFSHSKIISNGFFFQQHSTPIFSILNTPHHFLSLIQHLFNFYLFQWFFSFNSLPHHILFLILI